MANTNFTYYVEKEYNRNGLVIYILISIVLTLFISYLYRPNEDPEMLFLFCGLPSIIIKVIDCILAYQHSDRQNRNRFSWLLLALFFSSLALIVLAFLPKRKLSITNQGGVPVREFIGQCYKKAKRFFKQERFIESSELLNVVLNFNANDKSALELRALSFIRMKMFKQAKNDFLRLKELDPKFPKVEYYIGTLKDY